MRVRLQITFIFTLFFLLSCINEDSARKGRPYISDFAKSETGETLLCTDYTEIFNDVCYDECPAGQHAGTEEEIEVDVAAYVKQEVNTTVDESSIRAQLNEIIAAAIGICVTDKDSRPNEDINFNNNFCACKENEPYIINNCAAYCTDKGDATPTLYATLIPGPSTLLHNELGNTQNWCKKSLSESENNFAPSCLMKFFDGANTLSAEVIFTGDNSIKVDLSGISKNKTYVTYVEETESGAKTKTIHLRAVDQSDLGSSSPLKVATIAQYSCVLRAGLKTDENEDNFWNHARVHYYYPPYKTPPSLPPGNMYLICHDIFDHGETDSVLHPRLELVPNSFALWDKSDLRFYDVDPQNDKDDINDYIQERLLSEYSVTSEINIFQQFLYNYAPTSAFNSSVDSSSSSSGITNPEKILQGYYMQPWIPVGSDLGFCPTQSHYNGDDPIFKVLKEIVGVDTEGIYFARREPLSFLNSKQEIVSAPEDIIIIRESLLKTIWFHYEDSTYFTPTESSAGLKSVLFFYPPDPVYPHVQKDNQKIYTIFNPTDDENNTGAPRTNRTPSNKMFGCIPAMSEI